MEQMDHETLSYDGLRPTTKLSIPDAEIKATDDWANIVTEAVCHVLMDTTGDTKLIADALHESIRVELTKYFADVAKDEHDNPPSPSMANDVLYFRNKMERGVAVVISCVGSTPWQSLYMHPDIQDIVRLHMWRAVSSIIQANRA